MALVFLQVCIVFTISSFEFYQIKLLWLHRQGWVVPNSPDLSPLSRLREMLESYYKLQPKPKTVLQF